MLIDFVCEFICFDVILTKSVLAVAVLNERTVFLETVIFSKFSNINNEIPTFFLQSSISSKLWTIIQISLVLKNNFTVAST